MSAVISDCGMFRYRLERQVPHRQGMAHWNKVIAFFGVNPSTADATVDDATVRKWIGFCQLWGAPRFIVGNVFARRATDVRTLQRVFDPIGPDNRRHLHEIAAEADILVPCWGSRAKLPRELHMQLDVTEEILRDTGKPLMVFGLTASGDPKHPLMLGYDTKLIALGENVYV